MGVSEINEKRLATVNGVLAGRVRKLIALAAADGYTLQVTQSLRTVAEQDALYAQGRTKPGKKVTNARGGSSWHNFGLAVDFCFIVGGKPDWTDALYTKIGKWASAVNLEWGGSWISIKDKPHVQLTKGLQLSEARTLLKIGGLAKVWQKIESL